MDIRQQLYDRVQNACRQLWLEMQSEGVDVQALLPRDEIVVTDTANGVSVEFFADKPEKVKVSKSKAKDSEDGA